MKGTHKKIALLNKVGNIDKLFSVFYSAMHEMLGFEYLFFSVETMNHFVVFEPGKDLKKALKKIDESELYMSFIREKVKNIDIIKKFSVKDNNKRLQMFIVNFPRSNYDYEEIKILFNCFNLAYDKLLEKEKRRIILKSYEEKEAEYEKLLEHSDKIEIIYDQNGKILKANKRSLLIINKRMNINEILIKGTPLKYNIDLFRTKKQKFTFFKTRFDQVIPVEAKIKRIKYNLIHCFLIVIEVISEEFNTIKNLKTYNDFLENIFNNTLFGIAYVNKDGLIINHNSEFSKIFKINEKKILGNSIIELSKNFKKYLSVKSRDKTDYITSHTIDKKNKLFVRVYAFTLEKEHGSIALFIEDLTKKYQDEIIKDLFMSAIEKSSMGYFITEPNGKIIYVNDAYCNITGYSRNEILGNNPKIFKSNKQTKDFYQELWSTINSGKIFSGNITNKKRDGNLFHEKAMIIPIKKNKEILKFIAIKEDITEKTKLEEKKEAIDRLEALGRLTGGIGHDFNNLMTSLLILQNNLMTEYDLKYVEDMKKYINYGKGLTMQLLDFARNQPIRIETVNLYEFFKTNRDILKSSLTEKIQIFIYVKKDCHNVKIDKTKFLQVILNLVINARDAIKGDGKIIIKGNNFRIDDDNKNYFFDAPLGEYVFIEIVDSGAGISPEIMPFIFEPFFSTKEKAKGTGLGLPTSYGNIKKMGGYITVETTQKVGSTFKIILPSVYEIVQKKHKEKESVLPKNKEDIRILFIEDESSIRDGLTKLFTKKGYYIESAENGEIGIEKFKKGNFNVVITDLIMPKKNGDEVAREIIKSKKNVKIIIATGYIDERIIKEKDRSITYIQKPYDISEIEKYLF